ncbi:MAG: histidine kinase [Bacteroidales bacterium]
MATELSFVYLYARNYDVLRKHLEDVTNYIGWIKDTVQLSFIITGAGYCYYVMGDYERSNKHYELFFDICDKYPIPLELKAHFYRYTGINYERMGDLPNALEYCQQANELRKEINLNPLYDFMGSIYFKMDSLDKAEQYFQKYLELNKDGDIVITPGIASGMLGKIWSKRGQFKKAEAAFKFALELAEWVYEHKMYAKTKEADIRSNYMAHQSVGSFREDQALNMIASNHYELYKLYDRQSMAQKALDEYILYHEALKEYENFEQVAAIEEIKDRYEAEKKEQTITTLSQEKAMGQMQLRQSRIIVFAIGGLFLLAVALAILFIRMIRIRSEQKSVVLEQKLLRSQMNPHFIFNALSNITNLVEKQDTVAASKFLNRFARLVRHILESTREDFIPLDDELKNLENYLELQQLRFNDKFTYSIILDDDVVADEIMIPTMLVQPFVENAIEHGIKPKEESGHVKVRFYKQNHLITCEVEDDGIGREQAIRIEPFKHPHRSYGVAIARERLAAMSKKIRIKVKLNIVDLKTDSGESSGTKVIINMPYKMAV